MAIPTSESRNLFTKALIAVYKERPQVLGFLRSFFPTVESLTRYVSIEVRRGAEKVAVDVTRLSDGNMNTISKSTEKIYEPPLFWEYMDITNNDLYDVAIGASSSGDAGAIAALAQSVNEDLQAITDKIERAVELMCAQILETGTITLTNNDSVNFKRKAGSIVNKGAGNYWVTNTVDPLADIQTGCQWMRQNGKAQGSVFNLILGSTAMAHLMGNTLFQNKADLLRIDTMSIREPQRNAVGASSHGYITAGDYIVRLWTYPEFYDNSSGTSTPYLHAKKVILLPEAPNFKLAYAAVPQLLNGSSAPQRGKYLVYEHTDERKAVHEMGIKSAPIPVPVAVDQIYTLQVVA